MAALRLRAEVVGDTDCCVPDCSEIDSNPDCGPDLTLAITLILTLTLTSPLAEQPPCRQGFSKPDGRVDPAAGLLLLIVERELHGDQVSVLGRELVHALVDVAAGRAPLAAVEEPARRDSDGSRVSRR